MFRVPLFGVTLVQCGGHTLSISTLPFRSPCTHLRWVQSVFAIERSLRPVRHPSRGPFDAWELGTEALAHQKSPMHFQLNRTHLLNDGDSLDPREETPSPKIGDAAGSAVTPAVKDVGELSSMGPAALVTPRGSFRKCGSICNSLHPWALQYMC